MTDDALERSRLRADRLSHGLNSLCQVVCLVAVVLDLRTGAWGMAAIAAAGWTIVAFARSAMRGHEQLFRLRRAKFQDEAAFAALVLQKLQEAEGIQVRAMATEEVRH